MPKRQSVRSILTPQMRHKSLQELDGQDWGEAPHPSYVVTTVHRLRRTSLQDFTVEDLRIMIGQGFSESLPYLVPLALEQVRVDPLASGDFFPGDLLLNVVRIDGHFRQRYSDLRGEIETVADRALALMPDTEDLADFLAKDIAHAIEQFRQANRQ